MSVPLDAEPIGHETCDDQQVAVQIGSGDDVVQVPVVTAGGSEETEYAVETQVRTDGPAYITYLSDVYVPAKWGGVNVFDELEEYLQGQTGVSVSIIARSSVTDEWQILHHGWLRKIGSGGAGRLLRFRVSDYANLAQQVPISKSWEGVNYNTVLDYVSTRIEETLDGVTVNYTSGEPGFTVEEGGRLDTVARTLVNANPLVSSPQYSNDQTVSRSFSASNGDTAVDVLNWLTESIDYTWFFEPTGYDETAIQLYDTETFNTTFKTRGVGGEYVVTQNRAMYNIAPINRVAVVGQKREDVEDESTGRYVVGTATNMDLVPETSNATRTKVVRDNSIESAIGAFATAKDILLQTHAESQEGFLELTVAPELLPYTKIKTKAICDNLINTDVQPITYQVKEVRHQFNPRSGFRSAAHVGLVSDGSNVLGEFGAGNTNGDVITPVGAVSSDVNLQPSSDGPTKVDL